jgi:pimeloyl-ACP methyl ester carboxylesterase
VSVPADQFYIQRATTKWGKAVYANWNKNEAEHALVFIHGFNGSAMETFGDFNLEFRYRPKYGEYDVFFYSYDSLFRQIADSGLKFLDFIKTLHDRPGDIIKATGMDIYRGTYKKIVIVAHSLGAVVSRYALNEGYESGLQWLDKTALVLFAPAHTGAHRSIDTLTTFPPPIKFLGPLARYFVLTLEQLIDTSIIIDPLREKHKVLIENKGVMDFTIAKKVVWSSPDRVVINNKFASDPTAVVIDNKSHSAVCKPTNSFIQPFEELESIL